VNQSPGMNEREGLEPCPFCAKHAEPPFENLWQSEDDGGPERCWTIRHDCPVTHTTLWTEADTYADCIAVWNTRAPAPSAWQPERPAAFLAWAVDMFGPVAKLRSERLLRFVEEAIELAHAEGMERDVFNRVADRVYSRPPGEAPKEIGQAQACLETFAENIGLSSADEAQREWERVQGIPRDEWTRRHTAKQAIARPHHSPIGKAE
jgi:hypothetical protein